MVYKFVDIGTSYFCTSIDDFGLNVNGLLVEPIKEYLDIIPNSETVIKANYAISDSDRIDVMYVPISNSKKEYHSEKEMKKIEDARIVARDGCSALGKIHPEVPQNNKQVQCNVITFYKLCDLYDIKEIENLKIDTEGHDYIILEQVYNMIEDGRLIISNQIMIEYNHLINKNEVEPLIKKFEQEFDFKRKIAISLWGQFELILKRKVK